MWFCHFLVFIPNLWSEKDMFHLRQRQAAGDMNKQTKTYYGGLLRNQGVWNHRTHGAGNIYVCDKEMQTCLCNVYIYEYILVCIYIHIMYIVFNYLSLYLYTYRYIQIHTDTYRYIQIHTDTYRYIQMHTDAYRYIQIHTDTYRYRYRYIHTYTHTCMHIYIYMCTHKKWLIVDSISNWWLLYVSYCLQHCLQPRIWMVLPVNPVNSGIGCCSSPRCCWSQSLFDDSQHVLLSSCRSFWCCFCCCSRADAHTISPHFMSWMTKNMICENNRDIETMIH